MLKLSQSYAKTTHAQKKNAKDYSHSPTTLGPLFIVGTVGISLIGDTTIGIILLLIHILASITVGILFRFWKSSPSLNRNYTISYNYLTFHSNRMPELNRR